MKTNLVFMALGAALMFALMTLFKENSSSELLKYKAENGRINDQDVINAAKPIATMNNVQERQNRDSDVVTNASQVLSKQILEPSNGETADKKNAPSVIPDDIKKILTRATNPKLKTLQTFAEIKLRSDEQHQNDSKIFTDSIDFSLLGKDSSELPPEERQLIDQWKASQQELNANLETNRQSYEDSLRNLLNPEDLKQYRTQEALIADQLFDRSVESLTESYRESVSDLNDYQHNQLDSIIKRAQALEPALVPIGSTLEGMGYSTSHKNLMDSDRYTNVSNQINAVLSHQQQEQIRENGLQFVFGDLSQ